MTITVPVETGEELTIEVLDHDPEMPCISDTSVATHLFLTGVCPAHPLCLGHTEESKDTVRLLVSQGDFLAAWRCGAHSVGWTARPSEFRIVPAGATS